MKKTKKQNPRYKKKEKRKKKKEKRKRKKKKEIELFLAFSLIFTGTGVEFSTSSSILFDVYEITGGKLLVNQINQIINYFSILHLVEEEFLFNLYLNFTTPKKQN
ncbi:hypothetical protein BpHYR1_025094 [Brachionus plicatilis]|uniref:Uncharacterized protein n=1 Tax=Brachionus plicatilis TaxID=10195 RepID=A0A3M7RHB0_BRAPC|nr:hypothetical protein BpHYR1_025094 [Brachionus plicatilis]